MKQLIVGSQDLSQVAEKITWSGDSKQVARELVFTVASKKSDRFLPKVTINEGDNVLFRDDAGKTLFGGPVFDIEKPGSGSVVTYTALDLMFYVNNSDINKVFDDTPEAITAWICSNLGIPFGTAAPTGMKVYMPCLGKKAYAAIMMAYTAASRKNGKKYIPLMQNINQLCVIEKGAMCGAVLDGDYNLEDASYKSSLQGLVDRVLITDKNGNVVGKVENAEAQKKYGVVQVVYKQEDGKDANAEAKALLQTIEQSGSVTAISDTRAVSGYAIAVQEPISGLYGKFYIEGDTHTFTNGKAEMQLTLAFSNMMDEQEIEQENKT